jgi:hypothetical protein
MRTLLLFTAVMLAGCSSDDGMAEVHGNVIVDGQPATIGSISFFPEDGKSPTTGGEIVNGRYSVKVPLGNNRVQIRVSKKVGERKLYDTPDSPVQATLEEVLPAKYNTNSELLYEVVAGSQEKNWDLKSK